MSVQRLFIAACTYCRNPQAVYGCSVSPHPYMHNPHTYAQILDIPRTLEYLETQGVAVAALGVDEFPAFFTRKSGCRAPSRVDTPQQ